MRAFVALLGLCAVVCATLAFVYLFYFEGAIACILALLCWHVYSLQTERALLEGQLDRGLLAGSRGSSPVHGQEGALSASRDLGTLGPVAAPAPAAAPAPGLAPQVCARGDDLPDAVDWAISQSAAGSSASGVAALDRILLAALAKEYLRCTSALQFYRATYGPLEEDALASAPAAPLAPAAPSNSLPLACAPAVAKVRPAPLPDDVTEPRRSLPRAAGVLGLRADAEPPQSPQHGAGAQLVPRPPELVLTADQDDNGVGSSRAPTPRSPVAMPSPSCKPRRHSNGLRQLSASLGLLRPRSPCTALPTSPCFARGSPPQRPVRGRQAPPQRGTSPDRGRQAPPWQGTSPDAAMPPLPQACSAAAGLAPL